MKVYIAGPMTGLPQFNVPAFDAAAAKLRSLGLEVVSPAELDSPEMRREALRSKDGALGPLEEATGETWGHVLARDVKMLSDTGIEAIVLLPDWWKSRGATLETTVGLLNKLKFFQYIDGSVDPISYTSVLYWLDYGWRYRETV